MAAFIKRTRNGVADPLHLPFFPVAHTPDFTPPKTNDWLRDPDFTGVAGVDRRYWEVVGEAVVEMSQADKDAVDAQVLADKNANTIALIKSRLGILIPLKGIASSVTISGLQITVNIGTIVVNDGTTIVAHAGLDKRVIVTFIYNKTTDSFSVEVFEKLSIGNYEDLASDEILVAHFGEWEVVGGGTVLIPV